MRTLLAISARFGATVQADDSNRSGQFLSPASGTGNGAGAAIETARSAGEGTQSSRGGNCGERWRF